MARALIIPMETQQAQDERDKKRFLDSVSISELSPEEAEIVLMQIFPKSVPIDFVID